MRKRSWGRLGAAVSAVALLAGGLVGVAAPAQANKDLCLAQGFSDRISAGGTPEQAERDARLAFVNDLNGLSCYAKGFRDPQLSTPVEEDDFYISIATGTRGVEIPKPPGGTEGGETGSSEPVQTAPPPPPCWDASTNNCPVGGALRFTAPKYAMVGVPVTMYAYASWRPDANAPSQPTNGTAVIRVDGEDYSGVEFVDGVAEWRFIPETEGMKEFTASGVVFSGLSGANAYIDTVPARTYVLEYDPAAYAAALKSKRVGVGDT